MLFGKGLELADQVGMTTRLQLSLDPILVRGEP
jgi:hypothetical protein